MLAADQDQCRKVCAVTRKNTLMLPKRKLRQRSGRSVTTFVWRRMGKTGIWLHHYIVVPPLGMQYFGSDESIASAVALLPRARKRIFRSLIGVDRVHVFIRGKALYSRGRALENVQGREFLKRMTDCATPARYIPEVVRAECEKHMRDFGVTRIRWFEGKIRAYTHGEFYFEIIRYPRTPEAHWLRRLEKLCVDLPPFEYTATPS